MGMRSSAAWRSAASASSSCFLKCAMSSGWVRSSSRVSGFDGEGEGVSGVGSS